MKNDQTRRIVGSGLKSMPRPARPRAGFTLIELLVVIAIIAVLAAFTIPVLNSVARKKVLDRTRAEMAQLETAIESYKAAYGSYPPSNPNYNPANSATWDQSMISPLYFELLGTTNNNGTYYTLDGSARIGAATATMNNAFGVSGFINCSKNGGGEDAPAARNFLPNLKPTQFLAATNNTVLATVFVASVAGPDFNYQPFHSTPGFNPWRYVSPGINNPNSYDLWVQLSIGSTFSAVNVLTTPKKYLICNWTKQVPFNSPLP